ncbi:MAG: hypothetical protein RSC08_02210 [Oscillospiraceae bacterium]
MLITPAFAHSHPGDPEPPKPTISLWAQPEVEQARTLGLIPVRSLPDDYSTPLTRKDFGLLAMQFIAIQNHFDLAYLDEMISWYLAAPKEADPSEGVAILGGSAEPYACFLTLVKGKEAGGYDPNESITRQEAANLLMQAYTICGGTATKNITTDFQDAGAIDDGALKSVAALVNWNVIHGVDGKFAPQEPCSVEQGIVLFLRLFENAPVSRKHGNVVSVFTYEQCLAYMSSLVEKSDKVGYRQSLRIDGNQGSFIRLEIEGVMIGGSLFFILNKNGGIEQVDLGLCNSQTGANRNMVLENPQFSDHGLSFSCTVTLQEDVIAYHGTPEGILLHEKGVYHISIDMEALGQGQSAILKTSLR